MKTRFLLALFLFVGLGGAAIAQTAAQGTQTQDLVLRDDAKCTTCHDESDSPRVLHIGKTKHGMTGDQRTGTCTSCHGKSDRHIEEAEKGAKPPASTDISFSPKSTTPPEQRNQACLTCHQGGGRINWHMSSHVTADVTCASCHDVHTARDRVMVKTEQLEVCSSCHKAQRAQASYPSRHPMKEGKVVCSDCHNPHGSSGPTMLVKNRINETCYTCHTEKRGPFLWEHAPVREDCTSCHSPHGSINRPLLKARNPWLCQQCHIAQQHPSTLYSGTGVPPIGAAQQLLAMNCMNCHTQIHGTNHPSGPRKTR